MIGFYRLCRRPVTLGPIILQIYLPTKYDEITFHLSSGFKWKKNIYPGLFFNKIITYIFILKKKTDLFKFTNKYNRS